MLVFGEVFSGRRVGSCITPQLPCSVHLKDKRRNETWLIGASVIVTTRLSVDVSDTIFEVVGVITEVAVTAEGLIVVCCVIGGTALEQKIERIVPATFDMLDY
jgi:hypothetical protein